ncbi:hypothetical protein ACFL2X_03260 [Candidatus Latescibacterota bacterium]
MKALKDRWIIFKDIIFDPWVLLFLICTISLIFISQSTDSSNTLTTILSLLISISSAILGARIMEQWLDISESNILITRSKTAVRGLKLLLSNIFSMDKRIRFYMSLKKEDKININNLKLIFSDFEARCNILAEETVNSIENWTDITPEADVKTHIGVITELQTNLKNANDNIEKIKTENENYIGESTIEKEKLEEKLKIAEDDARQYREKLRQKEIGFGLNVGTQAATLSTATIIPNVAIANPTVWLNSNAKFSADDVFSNESNSILPDE